MPLKIKGNINRRENGCMPNSANFTRKGDARSPKEKPKNGWPRTRQTEKLIECIYPVHVHAFLYEFSGRKTCI